MNINKAIRTGILAICILMFLSMTNVLKVIYPDAETVYSEFLKYYYLEERLNEVLFCLLFLYAFLKSTGIRKGFACFGFVVTFASVVDKVFFGIYYYLSTDILILIFAAVIGYVAYKRQ